MKNLTIKFTSLFIVFISIFGICKSASATEIRIEEGTPVRLKLKETINSSTAQSGQIVTFEVVEEIKIDNRVVIAEGAPAWGTIVEAEAKKSLGRGGKLAFRVEYVKAVDGTKIPLRANSVSKGNGKSVTTGALVAGTAVVFFPAAPLFLLLKGKDVGIQKGQHFDSFVDGNKVVQIKDELDLQQVEPINTNQRFVSQVTTPVNSNRMQASGFGTVSILSTPNGAEVEVDGSLYGNTPTVLRLPAGLHTINIKSANHFDWVRTVNIGAGANLTMNAELRSKSRIARQSR
jgi:hypothetical protein